MARRKKRVVHRRRKPAVVHRRRRRTSPLVTHRRRRTSPVVHRRRRRRTLSGIGEVGEFAGRRRKRRSYAAPSRRRRHSVSRRRASLRGVGSRGMGFWDALENSLWVILGGVYQYAATQLVLKAVDGMVTDANSKAWMQTNKLYVKLGGKALALLGGYYIGQNIANGSEFFAGAVGQAAVSTVTEIDTVKTFLKSNLDGIDGIGEQDLTDILLSGVGAPSDQYLSAPSDQYLSAPSDQYLSNLAADQDLTDILLSGVGADQDLTDILLSGTGESNTEIIESLLQGTGQAQMEQFADQSLLGLGANQVTEFADKSLLGIGHIKELASFLS